MKIAHPRPKLAGATVAIGALLKLPSQLNIFWPHLHAPLLHWLSWQGMAGTTW
jgi:hypothetical protein